MSNARGESAGGVQSVDRAVSVLEILAQRGEAGVSEVAADIGVHKSTAFRLLAALEDRELVEQTQERGKYRLGFGILRLASAVPGRLDVTQQARPVCEQLAAQLGETVNIAVRRSHFVVNIDQARGPSAVATHNWTGELTPLHATSSGKVLLAFMTPENRRELLAASGLTQLTAHTITSPVWSRTGAAIALSPSSSSSTEDAYPSRAAASACASSSVTDQAYLSRPAFFDVGIGLIERK